MEPFIKINGRPFPYPKRGLELVTTTFVDSARNTAGQVVGQKVGRDQYKINQCVWPVLTAEQWSAMLRMLDEFFVTVTFPDQVTNSWRSLVMYPGDRTADPYFLDEETGLPTLYQNCRVNLIDAGYPSTQSREAIVSTGYDLQNKTVTSTTSRQIVKADPPYYGLSTVTVLPASSSGNKIPQVKTRRVTQNGVYSVKPDDGYEMTECKFTVNVPSGGSQKPTQAKSATYQKNGTYHIYPDVGKELTEVEITVDVSTGSGGSPAVSLPGTSRVKTYDIIPEKNQNTISIADHEGLCGIMVYTKASILGAPLSFFAWNKGGSPFDPTHDASTGIAGEYAYDFEGAGIKNSVVLRSGMGVYDAKTGVLSFTDYEYNPVPLASSTVYYVALMYA